MMPGQLCLAYSQLLVCFDINDNQGDFLTIRVISGPLCTSKLKERPTPVFQAFREVPPAHDHRGLVDRVDWERVLSECIYPANTTLGCTK